MSWSFEFVAKDKDNARRLLDAAYAPDAVKAFIGAAIDGLRDNSGSYEPKLADKAVHVKSDGHLCDGPSSYEVSTDKTEVKWIYIQGLAPAPEASEPAQAA